MVEKIVGIFLGLFGSLKALPFGKELIVFIFKLPLEWRTRNIKGQAKFFYTLLVFFWLL